MEITAEADKVVAAREIALPTTNSCIVAKETEIL
jgi:hypothetical protein